MPAPERPPPPTAPPPEGTPTLDQALAHLRDLAAYGTQPPPASRRCLRVLLEAWDQRLHSNQAAHEAAARTRKYVGHDAEGTLYINGLPDPTDVRALVDHVLATSDNGRQQSEQRYAHGEGYTASHEQRLVRRLDELTKDDPHDGTEGPLTKLVREARDFIAATVPMPAFDLNVEANRTLVETASQHRQVLDGMSPGETRTVTGTVDGTTGRWIDGPHEVPTEPEGSERPSIHVASRVLYANRKMIVNAQVPSDRAGVWRLELMEEQAECDENDPDEPTSPPDRTPFEDVDVRSLDRGPEPVEVELCSVCGLRWMAHLHLSRALFETERQQALVHRQQELGRVLKPEDYADLPAWGGSDDIDLSICVLVQGTALARRHG